MKKLMLNTVYFFAPSVLVQGYLQLIIDSNLISSALTVFSIFFGFYTTSFAVFATSKYLSKLYEIEDEKDNSKTLLDVLLEKFKTSTVILLCSIAYLITFLVILSNQYLIVSDLLSSILWGVITVNLYYAFTSISIFISVTKQSAKSIQS